MSGGNRNSPWLKPAALLLLGGVVVAIMLLSSQSYKAQTIQPLLLKTISYQTAERLLPGIDIRYDGKLYRRDVNPYGMLEFLFRKSAHMFVYGMLAAAAAFALRQLRLRAGMAAGLALLVVLLVAALDEWNQRYSQARTPALQDVLVDLAGGALSLSLCFVVSALYRKIKTARIQAA